LHAGDRNIFLAAGFSNDVLRFHKGLAVNIAALAQLIFAASGLVERLGDHGL